MTLLPLVSYSATITVELDGSGDYTQIQPALDAAASGDTVLIGPGEFTELIPSYIPGYGYEVEVCAYVRVPNLTIIGAGAGQTILGPTTYQGSQQTFSPKCMVWLDGNDRFVEGITFRNCYEGMHIVEGPLFVEACEFRNNGGRGIIWATHDAGGIIRNSMFLSTIIGNDGLSVIWGGGGIIVENCNFDNAGIYISSIQDISFLNCEMKNGIAGIELAAGARVTLNYCNIFNCSVAGVALNSVAAHCTINSCEISGDIWAVDATSEGVLDISNSILTGGSDCVIWLNNPGPISVHNSHIIKNGPLAINCWNHESLGLVTHDLTGNYWGTTNPDSVASWIWDQNDDPANFSIVNFLPMADGPVPTENTSFGSIKAMFR